MPNAFSDGPTTASSDQSSKKPRPRRGFEVTNRAAAVAGDRVVVVAPLERRARAVAADVDHRREVESLLLEVVVGGDRAVAGGVGASEGVVAGCFGVVGRLRRP